MQPHVNFPPDDGASKCLDAVLFGEVVQKRSCDWRELPVPFIGVIFSSLFENTIEPTVYDTET